MKKLFASIVFLLALASNAFATTYYASPSGGGAASCVDSGANVCTLQRAVTVASTGTHTIVSATGTYSISTELTISSTNTGANLTFTCAGAVGTCIWASTGTSAVVDVETNMVSGTLTFDGISISDTNADFSIRNGSPEVNIVFKNGTIDNTDATSGNGINYILDTTNKIALESGEDAVTGLHTGAATNVRIAQKIVPGANITVNRASMKLRRRCGNVGTNCNQYVSGESWDYRTGEVLTMTIETDSAGAPSGTPVTNGTAVTKLAYNVPYESFEHEIFTFASNVSLTSGTTYWLVLKDNYTASTSNYIEAALDTGNGYAGGGASLYNGVAWVDSVGSDFIFGIDRAHTRTLEVFGSTFNTRASNFSIAWANIVNIHDNTLTSTAGGGLGLTGNNNWTTTDDHYKQVFFVDNVISYTTDGQQMISMGTNTFARTYLNMIAIKGNTGTVSIVTQPRYYVKKFFFYGNDLEVQYAGNCPFQLGKEVDGVDPQDLIPQRFEQVVIENNSFYFSSTAHNHLFLFAMGSENGIFKNNTVRGTNTAGAGGGGWGMILKASNWKILGNRFAGPGPAIYVTNNYTTVVGNTFESYDATGSNSAILFRAHQDNIYGGNHGIPKFSFIEDNIFISHGAFAAMTFCDNTNCATASPSTLGIFRTEPYWSNRIDNNAYYATDNATYIQIGSGTSLENVTLAEGLTTLRATWNSATYTDSNSLNYYNDIQSSYIGPITGIDGYTGDFTTTDANVIGKGTVSGSNIGGYQVSGSLGGSGPFGTQPFGDPR